MVTGLEFPISDEAQKLRGSVGRTLNFLHRERTGLKRKPIDEMGGIDLIYEAVRENNPRGFNKKVMKQMRKNFRSLRRTESRLRMLQEQIQGVRND